jgi:hypothetical protein
MKSRVSCGGCGIEEVKDDLASGTARASMLVTISKATIESRPANAKQLSWNT